MRQLRKSRIDFAARAGIENLGLQPDGAGSVPYAPQCFACARTVGGVDENSHACGLGCQRTQEFQPFCCQLQGQIMYSGGVAPRPGEARNETSLDRVYDDAEDYRDSRCGGFGCGRDESIVGGGDDGHATTDEISHERRQPIEFAVQPVVLDGYILVLDDPVSPRPLRNAITARSEHRPTWR